VPVAAQVQIEVMRRVERVREGAVRPVTAQIRVPEVQSARPPGPTMVRDGSVAGGQSAGDSGGKSSSLHRGRHDDARRCLRPSRAPAARAALLEPRDTELICVYARDKGGAEPLGTIIYADGCQVLTGCVGSTRTPKVARNFVWQAARRWIRNPSSSVRVPFPPWTRIFPRVCAADLRFPAGVCAA
jgi:hypothetical protein